MGESETAKGKIVGALTNALAVLRYIADQSVPMGVNVIARGTGVSVSSCFNILQTLTAERLLSFDPAAKTYSLGLGLIDLAAPLLGFSQSTLIQPEIETLSRIHRCLVCLWHITEDGRIVMINRVSDSKTVRVDMNQGARMPAHAGAIGRCYAAALAQDVESLRRNFEQVSWQRPPAFDDYRADVERARCDGYAIDFGRLFIGLEIAAALITDRGGQPRYGLSGISIAGQISRKDLNRLGRDLTDVADWVSEALFSVPKGLRQESRASCYSSSAAE